MNTVTVHGTSGVTYFRGAGYVKLWHVSTGRTGVSIGARQGRGYPARQPWSPRGLKFWHYGTW